MWLIRTYGGRILAYLIQRQVENQINNIFGTGAQKAHGKRQRAESKPRKSKRFGKDVGEYVEYEEIKISQTNQTETRPPSDVPPESRISDAEWEDL